MAKGFFDDFFEGLAKDADMMSAIRFSKDYSGKIDRNKAAGLIAGLGYSSVNDMARLCDMIEREEKKPKM